MSKACERAIAFAQNPPKGIRFKPTQHKMLRAIPDKRYGCDYVAADSPIFPGERFDPMEKGDPVLLCFSRSMHFQGGKPTKKYEDWVPAKCISTGQSRKFAALNSASVWQEEKGGFALWRIPYRWRQSVSKLTGCYESREEVEQAMEEAI